jgi:hypothetical protein
MHAFIGNNESIGILFCFEHSETGFVTCIAFLNAVDLRNDCLEAISDLHTELKPRLYGLVGEQIKHTLSISAFNSVLISFESLRNCTIKTAYGSQ